VTTSPGADGSKALDLPDLQGGDVATIPAPVSDPWLESLIGYQVRHAQIALFRDFHRSLGDFGLSQQQFAALSMVGSNPGVGQAALADRLRSDRNTTTAIVDRLEARDLMVRRQSSHDRRRRELRLTSSGATLLGQMRERIEANEQRFLAKFTPEDLATLMRCLRTIHTLDMPD
jgi:DNA-binding MarR family transcriptional regulator